MTPSITPVVNSTNYTPPYLTCNAAVKAGDLECLKYLHENRAWSEDAISEENKSDFFDPYGPGKNQLYYIYDSQYINLGWNRYTCELAIDNNYFDLFKYCFNNGCKTNIKYTISDENFRYFKYYIDKGEPIEISVVKCICKSYFITELNKIEFLSLVFNETTNRIFTINELYNDSNFLFYYNCKSSTTEYIQDLFKKQHIDIIYTPKSFETVFTSLDSNFRVNESSLLEKCIYVKERIQDFQFDESLFNKASRFLYFPIFVYLHTLYKETYPNKPLILSKKISQDIVLNDTFRYRVYRSNNNTNYLEYLINNNISIDIDCVLLQSFYDKEYIHIKYLYKHTEYRLTANVILRCKHISAEYNSKTLEFVFEESNNKQSFIHPKIFNESICKSINLNDKCWEGLLKIDEVKCQTHLQTIYNSIDCNLMDTKYISKLIQEYCNYKPLQLDLTQVPLLKEKVETYLQLKKD